VRIFYRYLLRELTLPLLAWLAFLFLMLFLMQFLRGSEVLLGSAVTAGDIGLLTLSLAPHFLVMAMPIAFLLAILLGLGRLSDDRELVAMNALGVGPAQILAVPVMGGVLLGGLLWLLVCTAEPRGLRRVKEVASDIIKKNVVADVKPGIFYEDLTQLTLYAEGVEPKAGRWRNILIHDDRDPASPLLVLARDAQVRSDTPGEALTLLLRSGNVHRANRSSSDYTAISFERGEIAIGVEEPLWQKNRFPRSPSEELTPFELLEAADAAEAAGEDGRRFRMGFYARVAQAFSPLAFAVLGTPLAMSRARGGRARGFVLTLAGYVGYYVLSRVFEKMGVEGRLPFWLAGQLPNLLFLALGAFALWRVTRAGTAR